VALALGLTALAVVLVVTLSRTPFLIDGTNGVPAQVINYSKGNVSTCQAGETLPRDTSAVRLHITANIGPRILLGVLSGSHILTHGERAAGWGSSETVTVPITPLSHTLRNLRLCLKLGRTVEVVDLYGGVVKRPVARGHGVHKVGELRVEYLRRGQTSWWSRASTVARRMGLGHAPSGTRIVPLLILLTILIIILVSRGLLSDPRPSTSPRAEPDPAQSAQRATQTGPTRLWLAFRDALRAVPAAGWTCAVVACLSAVCWSFITPPFQLPDEPAHFAYVQQLAEAHSLPTSGGGGFSAAEAAAMLALHHTEVRGHPERHAISTVAEQRELIGILNRPLARRGTGVGVSSTEPPLYYTLETVPYWLASSGNLLDQLELMRLLSALFGGLTALFVYLFVREALPRAPWAWIVGGLAAALSPLLGFASGGVTPDAMLFTVSAAIFYCLARGFRRGLSLPLAVAIGVMTAIGFLTKLNFLGLAPGLFVGMVVLARRSAASSGGAAYRRLGLAVAIAVSPAALYVLVNLLSGKPTLGLLSNGLHTIHQRGSFVDEASYVWQFFLPRLPGMINYFPGISTTREIWFDRMVGLYGWFDVSFPAWVMSLALIPAALVGALFLRALVASRGVLRGRGSELLVYALMGLGVLVLIGSDSFLGLGEKAAGGYSEPRYLLPMLPLLGGALALSARGAGRRFGPAVGTLIVLLILGQDLFSQLQLIARFYG
jgi:hypothetical protein